MGLAEMWEKPWFKWTVIIVVIIILILAVIVATLQKPTVQSATVTSTRPGAGYVDIYVSLDVKNPNFIGGRLTDIDATAFLNDQPIGPVSLQEEVDVPGGKTTQINIILRVNSVAVGTNWHAAGTATVEVFGQSFEVPFDTQ